MLGAWVCRSCDRGRKEGVCAQWPCPGRSLQAQEEAGASAEGRACAYAPVACDQLPAGHPALVLPHSRPFAGARVCAEPPSRLPLSPHRCAPGDCATFANATLTANMCITAEVSVERHRTVQFYSAMDVEHCPDIQIAGQELNSLGCVQRLMHASLVQVKAAARISAEQRIKQQLTSAEGREAEQPHQQHASSSSSAYEGTVPVFRIPGLSLQLPTAIGDVHFAPVFLSKEQLDRTWVGTVLQAKLGTIADCHCVLDALKNPNVVIAAQRTMSKPV